MNETVFEVIGRYIAAVFDDVMPHYVTVGDGKNYTSSITNVSEFIHSCKKRSRKRILKTLKNVAKIIKTFKNVVE